tara:strand:+ start:2857 stop:4623 length:1767 start_codon:yes stop_codon:yes gene_type:complete
MLRLFFLISLSLNVFISFTQCVVDSSYTVPGIYPNPLPDGFVGQQYSEDITFVMPLDTMGAIIQNFEIVSIGLPVGLNWVCNNPTNSYNPQNNQYGCINVYGIPLLLGQYNVNVSVLVDVVSAGQNIDNIPIDFPITFNIDNPTLGNTGFSSSQILGCIPLDVNFTNNNPGLLQYFWDFGNGQTSSLENPLTQTYNQVGDFPVYFEGYSNLDTTDLYTLTSVTINSISGGWGPEYIPFLYTSNKPDPYFILRENGNLIYQSSFVLNDNGPNTWSVNINLSPDSIYTIDVMDADQTAASSNSWELTFGSDDYIGYYTIDFQNCNLCSAGSDAVISDSIIYQQILPVPSIQSVDTIRVGYNPGKPNIEYDSSNYVVYTDSVNYSLQWYLDSNSLIGHTNNIDTITQSGYYYLRVYNNFGCTNSSDSVYIVYCDPNVGFNIDLDGAANLYVTNYLNGYAINWLNYGQIIQGLSSNLISPTANGDYQALLSTPGGCKYFSNIYSYSVSIDEINSDFKCYPNPSNEQFILSWTGSDIKYLEVFNINGQKIDEFELNFSPKSIETIDYPNGLYLLKINYGLENSSFYIKHLVKH